MGRACHIPSWAMGESREQVTAQSPDLSQGREMRKKLGLCPWQLYPLSNFQFCISVLVAVPRDSRNIPTLNFWGHTHCEGLGILILGPVDYAWLKSCRELHSGGHSTWQVAGFGPGNGSTRKKGHLCHLLKGTNKTLRHGLVLSVSWRTSPRKSFEHSTLGSKEARAVAEVVALELTPGLTLLPPVGKWFRPQGSPGCLTLHLYV